MWAGIPLRFVGYPRKAGQRTEIKGKRAAPKNVGRDPVARKLQREVSALPGGCGAKPCQGMESPDHLRITHGVTRRAERGVARTFSVPQTWNCPALTSMVEWPTPREGSIKLSCFCFTILFAETVAPASCRCRVLRRNGGTGILPVAKWRHRKGGTGILPV